MRSDLYHLTRRLQTLSLSLNRQHDQGIVDLKKVELIEIYVELIEMIDLHQRKRRQRAKAARRKNKLIYFMFSV